MTLSQVPCGMVKIKSKDLQKFSYTIPLAQSQKVTYYKNIVLFKFLHFIPILLQSFSNAVCHTIHSSVTQYLCLHILCLYLFNIN